MHNETTDDNQADITRLRSIREQIDEDRYAVNTDQIADKMIDLELALSEQR